ncbi:MAG: FAD:protein FMN transferase [Azospirillaceae bacterium]|nr:FAD:protein FMN transferase [Azospirillaceae bacterium]
MPSLISRRRAISILAAAAGLPILIGDPRRARTAAAELFEWRGTAMGAASSIALYHPDRNAARALIADCVAEIDRLEDILSLYRPGSALCRLNRVGRLDNPPLELVELLAEARTFSLASDGAFDFTVQPLWVLYAGHFGTRGADPNGPAEAAIAAARARIDYRKVGFDTTRVELLGPDMALTFNGIAQGFVTDKVTALLRARGVQHVLVHLDKARAIGPHADGRPWQVGIADPTASERSLVTLDVVDQAVGTSGGYGTVFDPAGRFTHLFVPATGHCAHFNAEVTAVTATAVRADALSTTLSVVPWERAAAIVKAVGGATVYFVDFENRVTRMTA